MTKIVNENIDDLRTKLTSSKSVIDVPPLKKIEKYHLKKLEKEILLAYIKGIILKNKIHF